MNAPSAPELGAEIHPKDSLAGHCRRAHEHVYVTPPPSRQAGTSLLKKAFAVGMLFYFGKLTVTYPDCKNYSLFGT